MNITNPNFTEAHLATLSEATSWLTIVTVVCAAFALHTDQIESFRGDTANVELTVRVHPSQYQRAQDACRFLEDAGCFTAIPVICPDAVVRNHLPMKVIVNVRLFPVEQAIRRIWPKTTVSA